MNFEKPLETSEVVNFLKKQENGAKQQGLSPERGAYTQEFKESLNQLDVGVLQDIFAEELIKSGISHEDVTSRESAAIVEDNEMDDAGRHILAENEIHINHNMILESHQKVHLDKEILFSSVIAHELTHAQSFRSEERVNTQQLCAKEMRSGYRQFDEYSKMTEEGLQDKKTFVFAHLFNEGVTDLIASEVLQKYSIRSGKSWSKKQILKVGEASYHYEKNFVAGVVYKISSECGLPTGDVWNAFKRGYFQGENLMEGGLRDLMSETIDDQFFHALITEDEHKQRLYAQEHLAEFMHNPWSEERKSALKDHIHENLMRRIEMKNVA